MLDFRLLGVKDAWEVDLHLNRRQPDSGWRLRLLHRLPRRTFSR